MLGYETVIGVNDVKTGAGAVSFYAIRNTPYSTTNSVIPYDGLQLNIGGGMNLKTGVFTVPVNGRYFITFKATSGKANASNWLVLGLNDGVIGVSTATTNWISMPLFATMNLKKGDKIYAKLADGSLMDDGLHHTHFSGFLLEEDLLF